MTTSSSNLQYSVVIPHLSSSQCAQQCLHYLKENSLYPHEIIEILDETDVYYAFNKGVYQAKCETVVLLSDDMMVSKHWDKYIPIYRDKETILTGYVVEPNPGVLSNGRHNIPFDCGILENFDYDSFQNFVDSQTVPEYLPNKKGWYQPLVVNQRSFLSYPNISKFPYSPNDSLLIDDLMPKAGYQFAQIPMFVYHFQRQSGSYDRMNTTKRCIFSYNNFQVENKIALLQSKVIKKLNKNSNCKYEYLFYNAPEAEVYPDQVLNYAFAKLFYENNYDTILLLDIDCIPLSTKAIEYTFERAEQGVLIGNIQRSNHIENNKHVYVAPSAMCITKNMFESMNRPSFNYTNKGDVGEELTYIAEKVDMPIEYYMPSSYQCLPHERDKPWPLADGMPEYGIGTTFVNKFNEPMFYHLFQSRFNKFSDLFFVKCAEILLDNKL